MPLSVAICTPLMARVHQTVPQAGEMMFVDSSSSMDRYNLSTFILSTSHCGGGLPLGVMITSNEAAPTIQGCLSQLKTILLLCSRLLYVCYVFVRMRMEL